MTIEQKLFALGYSLTWHQTESSLKIYYSPEDKFYFSIDAGTTEEYFDEVLLGQFELQRYLSDM